MGAHYAYLVIERQRYPTEVADKAPTFGSGDRRAGGDAFPQRLRAALDAAAESDGYGSLERLLASVRVRGRSTPSRAAHVQGLLDAGLLSEDAEIAQMASGAVPDLAWEILGSVHPDRGHGQGVPESRRAQSKTRFIDSWSLLVCTGDGVRTVDVEPTQTPGHELPIALIARTLDSLAAEGWEVVHISEDRSINDEASASRVDCQRVLLRR